LTLPLCTTLSRLRIAFGVVRVLARMVGIVLHSSHRGRIATTYNECAGLQAVSSEMTARVRISGAGPVRRADGQDSAEAGARSDQPRMLDQAGFNNEGQRDRKGNTIYGCGPQITGPTYLLNGLPSRQILRSRGHPGDTALD
jgi:hypothetical protein